MPASLRTFLYGLGAVGAQALFEDPSNIITIPIERTMVGGRWVWES